MHPHPRNVIAIDSVRFEIPGGRTCGWECSRTMATTVVAKLLPTDQLEIRHERRGRPIPFSVVLFEKMSS